MSAPIHCPHCASTELERTEAGTEPMLHCLRCGHPFRALDRLASTISARLRLIDEEPAADEPVEVGDVEDGSVQVDESDDAQPPRVWEPPTDADVDFPASVADDDDSADDEGPESLPSLVHDKPLATRRRGGGFVRQLFGIVAGGLLGLLLGYYVLVLINGPEANFLGLSLPGLSTGDAGDGQPVGGRHLEALIDGLSNTLNSAGSSADDTPPLDGTMMEPAVGSTHVKGNEALRAGTTQFDVAELEQAIAVLPREPVEAVDANQYRQWSRVAELLTHLQRQGAAAETLAAPRAAIQQRLEQTLSGQEAASDVGRLATAWMQKPRASSGVLLVGTLQESRPVGDYWVSVVRMEATGESVATVSNEPPLVASGDTVRLLGVISFDPAGEFPGFTEPLPRAVWAAMLVPGQ